MKTDVLPPSARESRPRNLRVPSIDQVMIEERAAAFAKRSIKTSAKLAGLKLAISMMDLTTLEGKDTPGKKSRFGAVKRCSQLIRATMCHRAPRSASIRISSARRRNFYETRALKLPPSPRRFRLA